MGNRSMAVPSVAPDTHHGCPVARPKLSTVGCTVTRTVAGGRDARDLGKRVAVEANHRRQERALTFFSGWQRQ